MHSTNANAKPMTVAPDKVAKVTPLLLDNFISNITPVREIIINGLEAIQGIEGGIVTAELSRNLNRDGEGVKLSGGIITITDNGCGMSHDFAKNKFVHLAVSTKKNHDNIVGGFGFGAKSVVSISRDTTFRTVQNGIATVIVFSVNDNKITASVSEPTKVDEPNGTTVEMNVSGDIFDHIVKWIKSDFLEWLDTDTPLQVFVGDERIPVGTRLPSEVFSYTGNGTTVRLVEHQSIHGDSGARSFVLRCQGIPYSMDFIYEKKFAREITYPHYFTWGGCLNADRLSIVVDVNPENVTIDSGRDKVVETPELTELIKHGILSALDAYFAEYKRKIKESKNLKEFISLVDPVGTDQMAIYRVVPRIISFKHILSYFRVSKINYWYFDFLEEHGSAKDRSILFFPDEDMLSKTEQIREINRNNLGYVFCEEDDSPITEFLDSTDDFSEILGVDTSDIDYIQVMTTADNVVVNTDPSYEYHLDDILPDSFLERFGKEQEINLHTELFNWHYGEKFVVADKTFRDVREYMIRRGLELG